MTKVNRKRIEIGEEVEVRVDGMWFAGVVIKRRISRFGPQFDRMVVRYDGAAEVVRNKKSVRRPRKVEK